MNSNTIKFSINDSGSGNRLQLSLVYEALKEKGYDPVDQIVGFILTEDPAYITSHKNARNIMCSIDRYELLCSMIKDYLKIQ
ncbi:MAG TPA: IreB family regulatory phosphoprotein [Clostridiales bacterium]|jgi:uncharacterized protein (UPF0297 family)|nr:IreB family regulatory phosphoprotein [Clostridiales bacterium]